MSDPVSWLLIEKGWKVVASDGQEIGTVKEVTGDSDKDIFDGLAVSPGMLQTSVYVPAEHVGVIVEGQVALTIGTDEVERLGAFEEPAPQEEILPGSASRGSRLGNWFRGGR